MSILAVFNNQDIRQHIFKHKIFWNKLAKQSDRQKEYTNKCNRLITWLYDEYTKDIGIIRYDNNDPNYFIEYLNTGFDNDFTIHPMRMKCGQCKMGLLATATYWVDEQIIRVEPEFIDDDELDLHMYVCLECSSGRCYYSDSDSDE